MSNLRKLAIFNIIALLVILISDIVYACVGIPYVFKTLTSVLFVVSGIINFLFATKVGFEEKKYKRFAILMLVGLVFAMAGDILLIESSLFVFGAGMFAVGHIFFFVAYLQLTQFCIRDLVCFLSVFAVALAVILLYPGFVFEGIMKIVVTIYALIIALMLGKSISNLFNNEVSKLAKWLIFIGSLMFFLSDVCLLFNVFAGWGRWIDMMCIFLYYPAEAVLASTIFFASRKEY